MPGREAGRDYPRQFKGNAMAALFRHRRTFVDFVDAFIDLRGARGALRFDRAEMLPQGFVTEKLRAGARDVLWQVPVEDCGTCAVFLIEHQSAVDFSMPMRVQLYKHRIWQDRRAAVPARIRCAEGFRWPLVIPIVFYTGAAPWSGPVRLADILAHGGDFEELSAAVEFLLVDAGRLRDAQVTAPGNFARAIVRLIRALSSGDTEAEFFAAFEALAPYWKDEELDLICHVVYHYVMAHKPSAAVLERLRESFESEEVMESPRTLGRTVFDVWLDRGRAETEAASLRDVLAAIARFFARKNLPWDAYARDVQAVSTHHDALDLLTDLSTAPDPAVFLRERFGR